VATYVQKPQSHVVPHGAVFEDEPLAPAPAHEVHEAAAPPHPPASADVFHAFGHWLDDLGLGADSGGPSVSHTTPPGSDGTTRTTTGSIGGGQGTVTRTTTPGNGGPVTTQGVGVGVGGVNYTTGTAPPDGTDGTGHSTTYSGGPSGYGVNTTTTQTSGGNTTTNTVGGSVNPTNGQVTVSGGTTTNGVGVSGSGTIGPDGVSGSGTVQAGPVKAGITFGVSQSEVASTIVQGDQTSQVSDVLGGHDYIAASRSDEQKLGGNLAVKAVSLSADTTSNSTVQVFQKLPPEWSTMSTTDRANWQARVAQQQQASLGAVNGLGDVQLDQLPDGTGIRCRTANGWDAGAGVNYGAVSLSMGGGQTSASDVTVAKTNGKLEVSVVREDGLSSSMGAGLAGFGITTNDTNTNAHQVKFQVDPTNPDAMNAMNTFMKTGLLPGADRLTDKDGQTAAANFTSAKSQVDALNAQIQQLQAPMAQTGAPPDPKLAGLYAQLDQAQQTLATNRNYLNDRWEAQYGSKLGAGPMAGVAVDEVTDTNTKTMGGAFNTPVFDIDGGTETRTWVHRQYQGTGGAQQQFSFDDQYMGTEQHVGTDTDPTHVVLSMFTNTTLNNDTASTIKNIRNSDMPGYVVDGMVNHQVGDIDTHGQVNVSLNTQQLNMITSSLNDMNNPTSQKMWNDFAVRTSQFMAGQDFTLKTGDAEKDYASGLGSTITRNDWYNDLWARDQNDPLRKGLASFNATDNGLAEKIAAATFATIRTPADFQKLNADQQQLFISVLESTSGPVHDLTGQRNSYEALAACALLHDDAAPAGDAALRAQSMAHLFQESNDQGKNENTDAVFEFVRFTDRFKEDPARYGAIQQGMSFQWKQGNIDNAAATQTEQQIGQAMASGFHSKDDLGAGFDWGGTGKRNMVDMMEAANKQGGPQEIQRVVSASGISPSDMLSRVADDPVRQHMVADMLTEAGFDLSGIPLSYQCTP
jgi:hypothetical protein